MPHQRHAIQSLARELVSIHADGGMSPKGQLDRNVYETLAYRLADALRADGFVIVKGSRHNPKEPA